MRKKAIFCMLTLVMMSAASVNAQVVIGGGESQEPHTGAVLDLSPLGTDKLGLLLPNVALGSSAGDFVLANEADGDKMQALKSAARGLIVYNTKGGGWCVAGLYVWTGEEWKAIALAGN
jgi:hypothetical protein